MENRAAPGTSSRPAPSLSPAARRVSRAAAVFLIVVLLVVLTVILVRGPGGVQGQVQRILSGARWEEKRSDGGSQFSALTRIVTDLMAKLHPSRQWQGDYFYQDELVKLGTNAVPELLRVVERDASAAARRISAMALAELPAPGVVPVLIKALGQDKDVSVRESVAQALGMVGDTNAIPGLLVALRTDQDHRVRNESATALGGLGGPEIVPELLAVGANETNAVVRAGLAGMLGTLRDRRSLPLLVGWLQTPRRTEGQSTEDGDAYSDEQLVSAAATALGNIGGEEAFGALQAKWLIETNCEIRRSLCEAFGVIGDSRALPLLLTALQEEVELKNSLVEALGSLGDTNAVAELLPLLGDGDNEVRQKTAEALGHIGGLACVPELLRVAEHDFTTEVRSSACAALGMLGDPKAQEIILRVLPQLGDHRQEVVWALGHVGDTNAIAMLAELLSDKDRETRFAAAYALAEIGGPAAADAVAAQFEDKDDFARHGKACALAMLRRTNSLVTVREGLRAKEDWQRFGAALAFIRLGNTVATNEWAPMLGDRSPSLCHLASESVAGRAMPALTALLRDRDKDLRHYAARGLVFFNDASTLPALREACHDSDPEVRRAARVAVRCLERRAGNRN